MREPVMSFQGALVTAEEFARIPDDDHRYELVEGHLVRMSPPGSVHAALTARLVMLLGQYGQDHDLGVVLGAGGFKLAANPDTVREPDLAFIRRDRIPSTGLPEGFWSGGPDLAVEVRSPGDRSRDVRAKVDDYLARGVTLVWVVDSRNKTVTVHRRLLPPVVLTVDDTLEAGDVIPGFGCPVRQIFQ
jgi:Uma2 family endonuclease